MGTTGKTAPNSQKDQTHTTNLSLQDEVQRLAEGTSQKFVPAPHPNEVAMDLFEGLRRFKNALRWHYNFRHRAFQKYNAHRLQQQLQQISDENQDINLEEFYPTTPTTTGLGTGLHPRYTTMNAPPASHKVEALLADLQDLLFKQLDEYMTNFHDTNPRSIAITNLRNTLKLHTNKIIVPTDKTNSFIIMKTEDYESQMLQHLNQHGRQIDIPTLNQALQTADSLLLQLQDDLSTTKF